MGKHFRETRSRILRPGLDRLIWYGPYRLDGPVSHQLIVQVQEVKNNETEEIEMNEISSKSLNISVSDPEGRYPRTIELFGLWI